MVQQIGHSILSESRIPAGDTLSVRIPGEGDGVFVQAPLVQSLRESGRTIFLHADSLPAKNYSLDVSASRLSVRYNDMYRDGFLGSKKVRRTISSSVTCQVVKTATKEVMLSSSLSRELTDTVLVDDISGLERGTPAGGRGELPSEGFFDRALEPLMIIGATGVAVYLFFHVRS
ncbi:MAG: hypothetical protein HY033_07375 [Ignavibacteriae bacterium]|nr:hypothetical protein [Ignavibacteriota bacterium]